MQSISKTIMNTPNMDALARESVIFDKVNFKKHNVRTYYRSNPPQ